MAKKTESLTVRETIEVLQPAQIVFHDRSALEAFVEQKIAEMMNDKSDGIFEPFLQTKAIASEIRKRQTVVEQHKWKYYFEEWGCLSCHRKRAGHGSIGLCTKCYQLIRSRLHAILLRKARENSTTVPVVRDLGDVAREALRRRP